MRVTLDWDSAPALAANFREALRALTGSADLWDLAASANGEPVPPSDLTGPDVDADTAEEVQTALDAFDALTEVDPSELQSVADRLDLEALPSGSHFAGYGNTLSVDGMLRLRGAFGDDETRLKLDEARVDRGSPHLQLLFDRKYISRTETPRNTDADGPTWDSGNPARYVAGRDLTPASERVKDPDTGRLDYVQIIDTLSSDRYFGSRADLYRQIQGRKNTPDTRPTARAYDHVNGRRPIKRAEKKALRDYAEDRGIGHYADGRARDTVYSDELPEDTAAERRRALVEYVDIVWDDGDAEDDRAGDDYFRELNITTSTLNEHNTNRQLKVTHDHAVREAMDRLNPTSPMNGITLEHRRERAADVQQADGGLPTPTTGEATRNPDSLNWEDRRLDGDEAEAYLDNLPLLNHPDAVRVRDAAEKHPIIEITLYGQDPVNDPPIWHAIILDDGDRVTDGTVIEDSNGWW